MPEAPVHRAQDPSWEVCAEILERLPGMGAEERAEAVLCLIRNPSPGIRQRALRVGAAVLGDERLAAYLREGADDVLRNAGLEMLKLKGHHALPVAMELMRDPDPDVVLQAVLLVDHCGDPRAVEPLRLCLRHHDPNVVQAVLTALGHLGDSRVVADIVTFLRADPWLQVAAVQSLGDLKSTAAIGHLEPLLPDLFSGPFVAEAVARIGGLAAFRVLSSHWLRHGAKVEAETFLGLLAHVICGLKSPAPKSDELRGSLVGVLKDPSPGVRRAAAQCVLALGHGEGDTEALAVLVSAADAGSPLPPSLARRPDLVDRLLASSGCCRDWGFALVAAGAAVGEGRLAEALSRLPVPTDLAAAGSAVQRYAGEGLAAPLVELYLGVPDAERQALFPALKACRRWIKPAAWSLVPEGLERAVLGARIGELHQRSAKALSELDADERAEALSRLVGDGELVPHLPWREWLGEDAGRFAPLLAQAASSCRFAGAADLLRPHLEKGPTPELLRAAGELADRASLPILERTLSHPDPLLRVEALQSLGQIGGPGARRLLRGAAATLAGPEARAAYRALAACATDEESDLFREASRHRDWMVRLAASEMLGRHPTAENLPALCALVSDPVPAVAQRARTALET